MIEDLKLPSGSSAPSYSLILEGPDSTVCAKVPDVGHDSTAYQSETQLEQELIDQLVAQGYGRASFTDEAGIIANLRVQLEGLNGFTFTDSDWDRFFRTHIANKADRIEDKTRRIQRAPVIDFPLDDGSIKNIALIDRNHIHRNRLQVMNQYEADEGDHKNRYDVTILVNGLPLVHIEFKRRGVQLRQAFNQIERYQRESFWSESGLFEYVQIFVISNGTSTKYYSNTTRWQKTNKERRCKTSASYQFTSWWTDAENNKIADLVPFAASFLAKGTLLMILTHYCVFDVTESLLVMRPYQICATERILNRILIAENDKRRLGTLAAGGYIWHTAGSGKTLTSFKAAQLAAEMDGVDKVLFVVDRKDLDYQTMKEYNRFQEGAVNGSKDTRALAKNLEAPLGERKICVTTINKLAVYLKKNAAKHEVFNRHTVFIFDECHRSQFGEMHRAITKAFKNYHLFGFTGTPIFAQNSNASGDPNLRTTEQAFGDCLHTYTVVNAINDGNVLPFKVDYVRTFRRKETGEDVMVEGIDTNTAWQNPARLRNVATYILEHFDQKTKRNGPAYSTKAGMRRGFNSILACDSIKSAEAYYLLLKELIGNMPGCGLKIATVFSYAPNAEESESGIFDDEDFDTSGLPASDREFLDRAIADYNVMFSTNYSTDDKGFENYYKDISRRMKGIGEDGKPLPQSQCLDLLIVVDMFLTGFDAKTLNTLWVDKNLRMHGLIQAFSRTNRILNSVKTFGNIVCFRDLSDNVDEAIGLFGDPNAGGIVLLKSCEVYFEEYLSKIEHLHACYALADGMPVGEEAERDMVRTFSAILRLRNILVSFDGFEADDPMPARELQNYQSWYLDLRDKFKDREKAELVSIADDLVFEMDLIRQVEINIDYILMLVEKYHGDNVKDKEIVAKIRSSVASSPELRDKADLIEAFMRYVGFDGDGANPAIPIAHLDEERRHELISIEWRNHIAQAMENELDAIIEDERLRPEETRDLMVEAFETGGVPQEGVAVSKVMRPVSRFAKGDPHAEQRRRVTDLLTAFYERFRSFTDAYPRVDSKVAQ